MEFQQKKKYFWLLIYWELQMLIKRHKIEYLLLVSSVIKKYYPGKKSLHEYSLGKVVG